MAFHYKGKRSKTNPDLYEPDQLVADDNSNPAVGGVDWTIQSSAVTPPVPPLITKSRRFNPSERYFERHPDVLRDKPGVKTRLPKVTPKVFVGDSEITPDEVAAGNLLVAGIVRVGLTAK